MGDIMGDVMCYAQCSQFSGSGMPDGVEADGDAYEACTDKCDASGAAQVYAQVAVVIAAAAAALF